MGGRSSKSTLVRPATGQTKGNPLEWSYNQSLDSIFLDPNGSSKTSFTDYLSQLPSDDVQIPSKELGFFEFYQTLHGLKIGQKHYHHTDLLIAMKDVCTKYLSNDSHERTATEQESQGFAIPLTLKQELYRKMLYVIKNRDFGNQRLLERGEIDTALDYVTINDDYYTVFSSTEDFITAKINPEEILCKFKGKLNAKGEDEYEIERQQPHCPEAATNAIFQQLLPHAIHLYSYGFGIPPSQELTAGMKTLIYGWIYELYVSVAIAMEDRLPDVARTGNRPAAWNNFHKDNIKLITEDRSYYTKIIKEGAKNSIYPKGFKALEKDINWYLPFCTLMSFDWKTKAINRRITQQFFYDLYIIKPLLELKSHLEDVLSPIYDQYTREVLVGGKKHRTKDKKEKKDEEA